MKNKLARKGMTAALAAVLAMSMAMPAMANTQTADTTEGNVKTTKTITVTNTTDKANDSTKGTQANPYTLQAGSSITLKAEYTAKKAEADSAKDISLTDADKPSRVVFSSSNTGVVKTDASEHTYGTDGTNVIITAGNSGTAVITSTFYNSTGTELGKIETYVEVKKASDNFTSAYITDASGQHNVSSLTNGGSASASLNLVSEKTAKITVAAKGSVTYSSLNPSIATVDASGNVTAVGEGSAVIGVTAAETANSEASTLLFTVNVSKTAEQDAVTIRDEEGTNVDSSASDGSSLVLDAASTTLSGARHTAKLTVTSAAGATPTYTVVEEKDTVGNAASGKILYVATDGTVTAGAAGTAKIRVDIPAVTGLTRTATTRYVNVTVNSRAKDASLTVPSDQTIKVGDSITVKPSGISSNASDYSLEVAPTSGSETPANEKGEYAVTITKNADGSFNVKGNYDGLVTLRLTEKETNTSSYRTTSKTFRVAVRQTVTKAENTLTVSPSALILDEGDAQNLTVKSNSTGAITYKSSNPSVVTVDEDGQVSAEKGGSAVITVSSAEDTNTQSGEVSISVVVKAPDKQGNNLAVSPTTISVTEGKTAKLDADSDSTGAITFTSSDPSVATVAADGTVTGVKAGNAVITVASAGDDSTEAATAYVSVTVNAKARTVTKPGKVKSLKVSNVKGNKIKVTYAKLKGAKGYQVRYVVGKKTYKTSTKKTSLTISKGIKAGSKVKVSVRAYKTGNGKKIYGSYSKAVTITVDKK